LKFFIDQNEKHAFESKTKAKHKLKWIRYFS
jgi:hypothetical protein